MTKTLGRHPINASYEIIASNSRAPETLAGPVIDLGPRATVGTNAQAAERDVDELGERA